MLPLLEKKVATRPKLRRTFAELADLRAPQSRDPDRQRHRGRGPYYVSFTGVEQRQLIPSKNGTVRKTVEKSGTDPPFDVNEKHFSKICYFRTLQNHNFNL